MIKLTGLLQALQNIWSPFITSSGYGLIQKAVLSALLIVPYVECSRDQHIGHDETARENTLKTTKKIYYILHSISIHP
jgi:hypothetical protein